ncbi:MAG: hypothetical protein COZ75_09435 [Flavobacteriaceae bacterium CG_4_8_14_3_um_filter_34_10]|nr:DUF2480 family protein [Flavobacteriia bacterium]OIP51001.1 MAG: hypothetical protein AUK33_05740 [Flavobacteriaceae bacterium CG2_30_34_30]PIQ18715.1 MAG: hypothetical protein COW66_05125 [Flavobacteriaceae bacterium CG18_big_fil_WC_8_21_14_2_50_34_36]PIX08942.1 MAG: hypothetical protein COZ75_09435 [Flavobacteriaceae bacterium CG_4_8_14_3_um_filter_34_10]PIZ07692.1 MAG: hypothetical protein COY56_07740 [Flavobacteriaceae bacterium CG_4_10_14_0_8_um_filter_34_31]PJC07053.1 MAG: hypothetica
MLLEITNRVANSKLVTINLEDYYLDGKRVLFDIKDWLFQELVLKEKDFREHVKNYDWSRFKNHYVALHCSTEAIIPGWAYLLITVQLTPYAKKIVVGTLEDLETILYTECIQNTDFSNYKNAPLIIKGCSKKPVPQNAYILLTQKLQPIAKSLLYGEACSSVPLYKKK